MSTAAKNLPVISLPSFKIKSIAAPSKSRSAYTFWILTGLIFLVALISLFFLSKQSLRLDEAQSLWQSSRTPAGILRVIAEDVHVPLYGLMLHFWEFLFGTSVFAVRMMSLLFFMAAIPLTYFVGKLAYNRTAGIYAAVLVAVSPFLNWYGNEIRMYSLMVAAGLANNYFFLQLFHQKENAEKRVSFTKIWIGYILTAFIGIYTHYFFWLMLLTQGLFFLLYRRLFPQGSLKKFIFIAAGLLLTLSPWLYFVYHLGLIGNSTPLIFKPTSINLFNTFSQFLFGFQDDHLNTLIVSLWPLTVAFVFLSLRKNQKIPPQSVYFFLSAILPLALVFLISITLRPIFLTRYLIFTVPSLYLFLAWFLSAYPQKIAAGLKTLLVLGMVFMLINQAASADTPVKEDYQQAAALLNQETTAEDVVILSAPFTVYPVEYYYTGPAQLTTLPVWDRFKVGPIPPFNQQQMVADINNMKQDHNRAFLLLSYDQGYQKNIQQYFDANFQRLESHHLSPGMDLYVYKLKYGAVTFDSIMQTANAAAQATTSLDSNLIKQ